MTIVTIRRGEQLNAMSRQMQGESSAPSTVANPTNVALQGNKLYSANLGRWHITFPGCDLSQAGSSSRRSCGATLPVDFRPPEEFALGHIPGAIDVPLGGLESRIEDWRSLTAAVPAA